MALLVNSALLAPGVAGLRVLEPAVVGIRDKRGQRRLLQYVSLPDAVAMVVDVAPRLNMRTLRHVSHRGFPKLSALNQASCQSLGLRGHEMNGLLTVLISDSVSPDVQLLQAPPMLKQFKYS